MSTGHVELVTVSGRVHADLQTAAHAIREEHRQVEEALRAGFSNALTHAIQAGRKLAYARSLVPHGGWGLWVERNLPGISGRTERLYRQLAAAADADHLANWQRSANLRSKARSGRLRAGSDTDDAASGRTASVHSDTRDDRRQSRRRDPISRLIDYGEPFALDDEDLDAEDLENELAANLRDKYPTHAAEWAQWWAERFAEAGRRVR